MSLPKCYNCKHSQIEYEETTFDTKITPDPEDPLKSKREPIPKEDQKTLNLPNVVECNIR